MQEAGIEKRTEQIIRGYMKLTGNSFIGMKEYISARKQAIKELGLNYNSASGYRTDKITEIENNTVKEDSNSNETQNTALYKEETPTKNNENITERGESRKNNIKNPDTARKNKQAQSNTKVEKQDPFFAAIRKIQD